MSDWTKLMETHFPMMSSDESWELAFVDEQPGEDMSLRAVLRTITWDVSDGQRAIRDIKEQVVLMGRTEHLEMGERYAAYLRALGRVLADCDPEKLQTAMPADCVAADALDLVSARDEESFVSALGATSRLGKLTG